VRRGAYAFDLETRRLTDETGGLVARFSDGAVAPRPLPDAALRRASVASPGTFECVSVVDGEIIEEIHKPSNDGAFFVLPSQLNGAEYPSHTFIVSAVEQYKHDHTGGPRGQLAVHPAAAQFLLDNAACDHRPGGINSVDVFLERVKSHLRSVTTAAYDLHVKNGYLAVPDCPPTLQPHVLQGIRASLHTMRCLCMQDVPACGLAPSLMAASKAVHRVSIVYASAIPVQAYLNRDCSERSFQEEVGRLVIVGQYLGALRAALGAAQLRAARVRVFLMPLGGGVFNNRAEVIADAMSSAVELLATDGMDVRKHLDVRLLTFRGKPTERTRMEGLLRRGSSRELQEHPPPEGLLRRGSSKELREHTPPERALEPAALAPAVAAGPAREAVAAAAEPTETAEDGDSQETVPGIPESSCTFRPDGGLQKR